MHLRRLSIVFALVSALPAFSQTAVGKPAMVPTPPAATAQTAVPALLPFSSLVTAADGKPLTGEVAMTFLLFKEESGGEPLWSESQLVALDALGHYSVQLGASSPSGVPLQLFASGEVRWLEVQPAGQKQQPRILLSSVPYALKAADATTLGGLPASAYALASNAVAISPATAALGVTPDAASNVTTAGGASGYMPLFTGASSIGNSIVIQNTSGIGIGDIPNGTLDVNGKTIIRGPMQMARIGNATTSAGVNSNPLVFFAQGYDTSTKGNVGPYLQLQAEPTGNNTAAPGATLHLLYNTGLASGPSETGFYFNANGTVHFAAGQTFSASSTTGVGFTATSNSGTGLEGASTSGIGVLGKTGATAGDDAGVTGIATNVAGVGVFGAGTALSATGQYYRSVGDGAGVWGDSAPSALYTHLTFGVMGTADDQYAGVFYNNSPNGAEALWGYNNTQNQGIAAALFGGPYGTCIIDTSGDLSCSGTKSAVVPVDQNTRQVALYAVESPENWFEDFGSGQLANGSATVALEPTFAQTVNLVAGYHVFLTPNGDSKGLYISKKTPTSFEVRESGSGRSTLAFDYRIVARRKGYETVRLADKTRQRDLSRSPQMLAAKTMHTAP